MISEIELIELLSAKFCHDLAGPIGAINNSIEFLKEENEIMKEKALKLIELSSKQSVARLQFFRQAYGLSPNLGEANLYEIKNLISNFFYNTKINLNWSEHNISNPNLSIIPSIAKIILNLSIIIQNILIHGGVIDINIDKIDNNTKIEIKAIGNDWKIDPEAENILLNNSDGKINTKNVQIYLTENLIRNNHVKISIEKDEKYLKFNLEQIKSI